MTETVLLPNQRPNVEIQTLGVDLAGAVYPNSLTDADGFFPGQPVVLVYDQSLCTSVVKVLVEKLLLEFADTLW